MMPVWRSALRIRMVELEIARRYGQPGGPQPMRCPIHLSLGQEWVAAAICAALKPEDMVVASHRNHAAYLAKGGSLASMIAELYGRANGCCGGRGGSMHLMDRGAGVMWCDPIVGAALPLALGLATRCKDDQIVVAFCGDGAGEEGALYEALNLASLWKLPLLTIIENNELSVNAAIQDRQVLGLIVHGEMWRADVLLAEDTAFHLRKLLPHLLVTEDLWRAAEHCGPVHELPYGAFPASLEDADSRDELPVLLANVEHGDLFRAQVEITDEIERAFRAVETSP